MAYNRGYLSGEFKEQDSPAYQHQSSKISRNSDRAKSKQRQKEEVNKKLRSSDGPRNSNDQFVSNDQKTSSPRKHCDNFAKNPPHVHQSASSAFVENENAALETAQVSNSYQLCTENNRKMESWKKPDDLENAREVHHRKFQATLDSLVEEFESSAFATRNQHVKALRVGFRVHYVTHSSKQILAVTGNHHNLGDWKRFVPLKQAEDGFWFCTIILPMDIQLEWKFILVEDGEIVRWEECGNRQLVVPRTVENEELQLNCTWRAQ